VLVLVDAGESASSEQLSLHSLHTSHVIMFSIRDSFASLLHAQNSHVQRILTIIHSW